MADRPLRGPRLDDSRATADWGWKARVKVDEMVEDMLANVDVGMSKAA